MTEKRGPGRPKKTGKRKTNKKREGLGISKLEATVSPLKEHILHRNMLVVDPSSGSRGSQPGYCLFQSGKIIDWGVIHLPVDDLNRRLHYLVNSLRNDFEKPDVLVVEKINAVMAPGRHHNPRSMVSLQRAIGAVISVWDVPLVEISPMTWHARCPHFYVKSDDNDAIMMGISCVQIAYESTGQIGPGIDTFGEEVMQKLSAPATEVMHATRRRS